MNIGLRVRMSTEVRLADHERGGDDDALMKVIRAPWIRCRADEAGARAYEMECQRITFSVLAYSEDKARSWWNGLDESERNSLLGLGDAETSDQISLW